MVKSNFTLIIIVLINFYSCKDNSPTSNKSDDKWIENLDIVNEIIANVDTTRIRQNMIQISSFISRDNYSKNIEDVQECIKFVAVHYGLTVEIQKYLSISYYFYFASEKVGFMYSTNSDLRTADGGKTWYPIELPTFDAIHFIDSDNGFISSKYGSKMIMATNDGGIQWDVVKEDFGGTAIYFGNILDGYLFDKPVIYETFDGGHNWQELITIPDAIGMFCLDKNHAWLDGINGYYRTSDGWINWSRIDKGTINEEFGHFKFLNPNDGFVKGSDTGWYITHDGGNSLEKLEFDDIIIYPPNIVYGRSQTTDIYKSINCGITFNKISSINHPLSSWIFGDPLNGWALVLPSIWYQYIYRTQNGGITWENQSETISENVTWENLVIELPGKKNPKKQVILMAHYDATGSTQGADDNASGMTVLFESIAILSQFNFSNSIKIVFVSGEEEGLRGSRYYSDRAKLKNDEIIAVLNIDVIGYWIEGLARDLNIIYNPDSQELADNCLNAIGHYTSTIAVKGFSFGPQSDHESFWSNGYPAVWFCEAGNRSEMSPYANLRQDIIETINFTFLSENIKAAIAAAASLAIPVTQK